MRTNPFIALGKQIKDDTQKELRSSKDASRLRRVITKAHEKADEFGKAIVSVGNHKLACGEGCHYCCYYRVDVHAPETFAIVDYLRRKLPAPKVEEIRVRASSTAERISKMSAEEQLTSNVPCSLLENGKCLVYEARPFACRRHHSRDVNPCKHLFENPNSGDQYASRKTDVPQLSGIYALLQFGVKSAFASEGFDPNCYDLNASLAESLSDPRTEARWRDGKRAFSSAALTKDNAALISMDSQMEELFS